MKRPLSVLSLVLSGLVSLSAVTVTLTWQANDPNQEIQGYVVYQSTNVAAPFKPVAIVKSTNAFLDLTPGRYYFFVTASNAWSMESPPSNTAHLPDPPTKVNALNVLKPGTTQELRVSESFPFMRIPPIEPEKP